MRTASIITFAVALTAGLAADLDAGQALATSSGACPPVRHHRVLHVRHRATALRLPAAPAPVPDLADRGPPPFAPIYGAEPASYPPPVVYAPPPLLYRPWPYGYYGAPYWGRGWRARGWWGFGRRWR